MEKGKWEKGEEGRCKGCGDVGEAWGRIVFRDGRRCRECRWEGGVGRWYPKGSILIEGEEEEWDEKGRMS